MSGSDRERRDGTPAGLDEDAPVTPAEQARAESFGDWLDGLAAGEPLPPAMDSEDRALLETATMVLASSHAIELAPERTRRLVDQALESAMVGIRIERPSSVGPAPLRRVDLAALDGRAGQGGDLAARSSTDLILTRRRRADRVLRHLPWAVASLAAAAAVVLFMTRPVERARPPAVLPIQLSVANTSRPADSLVGVIGRPDAGRASERLDVLFADRMDGYRDLHLRRALGKVQP